MIQVLNRALNILEFVAKNPKSAHTLSEIAAHLELNPSTCANIVKTLVNRNYLEQVGKKKGYRLGSMSYYLTNNYTFEKELIEASEKPMKELREATNEGCILTILRGDTRIIIHEEKSKAELQVMNYTQKNAYATSTGRLIISHLNEDNLKNFVNNYGLPDQKVWAEVESWEDLVRETSKIRERGISKQESSAHIIGIAVPIKRKGKVISALGIYMPAIRLTEEIRDDIIEQLKHTAEQINDNIKKMQNMRSLTPNKLSKHLN